jgi:DNA-binding response OmpR family regulator
MVKVLIVEDTPDLAGWIARELQAANFTVLIADNGRAALDLHDAHTPDLVILDWNIPELDGLEVLRQLRRDSATPVLMLTGRAEEIDRVVGLEVGADDYLVKPFSMRELLARVRAMLRRAHLLRQQLQTPQSTSSGVSLNHHELSLNVETYNASLAGRSLQLSRLEFDLLHLFLNAPGRVFERDYLLDQLWKDAYDTQDRSVDYVIHRLRRKLEPHEDLIETVRGVGYRLRP